MGWPRDRPKKARSGVVDVDLFGEKKEQKTHK